MAFHHFPVVYSALLIDPSFFPLCIFNSLMRKSNTDARIGVPSTIKKQHKGLFIGFTFKLFWDVNYCNWSVG